MYETELDLYLPLAVIKTALQNCHLAESEIIVNKTTCNWEVYYPNPLEVFNNTNTNRASLADDRRDGPFKLSTVRFKDFIKITFQSMHYCVVDGRKTCVVETNSMPLGLDHEINKAGPRCDIDDNCIKNHSIPKENNEKRICFSDSSCEMTTRKRRGRPKKSIVCDESSSENGINIMQNEKSRNSKHIYHNHEDNFKENDLYRKSSYSLRGKKVNAKIIQAEMGHYSSDDSDHECNPMEGDLDSTENNSFKDPCYVEYHENKEARQTTRAKQVNCELCDKKFCDYTGVHTHVLRKHKHHHELTKYLEKLNDLKKVVCDLCLKEFPDSFKYLYHVSSEHSSESTDHSCKTCLLSFKTNSLLKQHVKHAHLITSKQFTCNICQTKFKAFGSLKQHVEAVHKKSRVFTCQHCNKHFFFNSQLNRHLKIHGQNDVQKFSCNICNKEFRFKHNLKRHNETLHSVQLEKWHCSYCGKGFHTKYGMISHVKLQHFSLLPYVCQVCNAGFMKFNLLFEHLSTVHGQNIVKVNNPPRHTIYNKQDNEKLYCSYCSKEFLHKVRLIEHMHSDHANDFPCKCETCNQGFLKKSFLVIHALKAHAMLLDLNDADDENMGTGNIMQVISTGSVMPSKAGEQEKSTDSLVPDQHFFCDTSAQVTEDANPLVSGATNTQELETETCQSTLMVEVASGDKTYTYIIEAPSTLGDGQTLTVTEDLANILVAAEQSLQQEESTVGYQEQVCNLVHQEPMQTGLAETVYYELDGSLGIHNNFSVEVQSTCESTQQ
ncbi:PR domain zinc finger protein 15-like [Dreissena polymorpha]|uniref:C2H2-type domain-containing protein n=1 Tax=Dreissena polymorpha TaxID=45954 RepID=A0A9D4LRV4_DREPO|nr:PR domain zinc finger protein 15-like [Dreissena polymorpha]KAH3862911.1 hypothetical protein DPMN_025886 [Dreissena polymorpha]